MFHKRLLKEFSDTTKYTAAVVFFQWIGMAANLLFLTRLPV